MQAVVLLAAGPHAVRGPVGEIRARPGSPQGCAAGLLHGAEGDLLPRSWGLSAGAQRAASSVYGGHDPGAHGAHFPSPSSSVSTPPAAGPALPTPPHPRTAKAPILHTSHNALHFICNPPGL